MARKIAHTEADPTLPKTSIEIEGNTYNLCFDLAALAEAEMHFSAQGHDVNLLVALPSMNLNSVRVVFPCAIHKFHPEVGFAQAQAMITMKNMQQIGMAIVQAWGYAIPEPEAKAEKATAPENPQSP